MNCQRFVSLGLDCRRPLHFRRCFQDFPFSNSGICCKLLKNCRYTICLLGEAGYWIGIENEQHVDYIHPLHLDQIGPTSKNPLI